MKAWRWECIEHDLTLLTMQTGVEPPVYCSGLVDIVYPDSRPCWFTGEPVLSVYPLPGSEVRGSPQPLPPSELGSTGEAGTLATPRVPATRHTT